jgi:putative sugar O-methyltransferase
MNAASTIPSASADDDKIGNAIVQVDDEIEILDHMLEVTRTADELLRPTNYWSNYQKRILSDLRSNGLRGFRRRKFNLLRSFGAVDVDPYPRVRIALPRGGGLISRIATRVIEMLPGISLQIEGHSARGFVDYGVWIARQAYADKGLDLTPCQTDRIGNPLDVHEVDGELWSRAQLGDSMT